MSISRFEFRTARAWRAAVLALAALALVVGALWAFTLLDRGETRVAWLALAALPLAAWATHAGRNQAVALRDEGGCWWLETPPGAARPLAGTLRIAFDFGNWMLLRFVPEGGRQRWLAPSQADMPEAWPAFRRAVYSPRIAPAGLSAQAPADPPA